MTTDHPTRRGFLALAAGTAFSAFTMGCANGQSGLFQQGVNRLKEATGGGDGSGDDGSGPSAGRIVEGLKEALRVGTSRVLDTVGRPGGYLRDSAIHIPLPGFLGDVQPWLERAGAGGLLNDLETRMNRAAETAAPKARDIFLEAIGDMTVGDARDILNGPEDAATAYFRRTMTPDLKDALRPIVDRQLAEAGAVEALETVRSRVADVPFAPGLADRAKDRLVDHTSAKAIDGIFHYLAKEEARIRKEPAARTRDVLREVFG